MAVHESLCTVEICAFSNVPGAFLCLLTAHKTLGYSEKMYTILHIMQNGRGLMG